MLPVLPVPPSSAAGGTWDIEKFPAWDFLTPSQLWDGQSYQESAPWAIPGGDFCFPGDGDTGNSSLWLLLELPSPPGAENSWSGTLGKENFCRKSHNKH